MAVPDPPGPPSRPPSPRSARRAARCCPPARRSSTPTPTSASTRTASRSPSTRSSPPSTRSRPTPARARSRSTTPTATPATASRTTACSSGRPRADGRLVPYCRLDPAEDPVGEAERCLARGRARHQAPPARPGVRVRDRGGGRDLRLARDAGVPILIHAGRGMAADGRAGGHRPALPRGAARPRPRRDRRPGHVRLPPERQPPAASSTTPRRCRRST